MFEMCCRHALFSLTSAKVLSVAEVGFRQICENWVDFARETYSFKSHTALYLLLRRSFNLSDDMKDQETCGIARLLSAI